MESQKAREEREELDLLKFCDWFFGVQTTNQLRVSWAKAKEDGRERFIDARPPFGRPKRTGTDKGPWQPPR